MTTQHSLTDNYSLDDGANIRLTRDGYLTANVRIARTGIQTYTAAELGLTDRAGNTPVIVYRPPEEVFHVDAMRSMSHRPITDGHPSVPVTADNWASLAKGDTGDEVMRDGDFVRVPIKLMDQKTIDKVTDGKRELSVGYTCDLEFIDGTTEDGHKYEAVQRNIRGNHLAICDRARGGKALAIIDERRTTPEPIQGVRQMATKTITFDGLPVEVTDAAEAVIRKLEGQISAKDSALTTANTTIATLTADRDTLSGEKVALEAKVADAEITPAKLQIMVDARAKTIEQAKRIAPNVVTDGKTDAEIRKAAVAAKLGDAATALNDDAIAGAFAALVPVADGKVDGVAKVIGDGLNVADAANAYKEARNKRLAEMRGETVN